MGNSVNHQAFLKIYIIGNMARSGDLKMA